jgi:hypothetical protein
VESNGSLQAAASPAGGERDLWRRVCHDYLEMPGLRLTLAQAARLWSIDAVQCRHVLNRLVDEAFLRCEEGLYMRADCDSASW